MKLLAFRLFNGVKMAMCAPGSLAALRTSESGRSLDEGITPQRPGHGTSGPVIWKVRRDFQLYQNTTPAEMGGPFHQGDCMVTARQVPVPVTGGNCPGGSYLSTYCGAVKVADKRDPGVLGYSGAKFTRWAGVAPFHRAGDYRNIDERSTFGKHVIAESGLALMTSTPRVASSSPIGS